MIDVKDEVIDITDEVIAITEELDFDFEMNENILHKDPNLYTNMFSPISDSASKGEETNQSYVSEDQDENYDVALTKCFTNISEIMQYLKEDIMYD